MRLRFLVSSFTIFVFLSLGSSSYQRDADRKVWLEQATIAARMGSPLKFRFSEAPHLHVAAESWPPHIRVNPVDSPERAEGPMANFLEALARSLNFTYSVVQGDGYWGAPQENGSWNGMIGMVIRGETDFGLGPFGMSYTRNEVVDFTLPLFREVLHVLVARPTPQPDPWGFVAPFTWLVWVGLVFSLGLVVVLSAAVDWVLEISESPRLFSHFWMAYQIFTAQNISDLRGYVSFRLSFLIWMMAMLIVIRSYSGAMTSILAVKTVPLKFDSLRDVLDDSKIKILMEGSTALTGHLKTVQEGIYKDLADALENRGTFVRASAMQDVAYEHIPKGRHAMLLEAVGCNKVYSDYFSNTGRCDFYKTKGVFWPLYYALIVPNGSPLGSLINARILALREFGIYERWALDQTPNMTHCIKMPTKIKTQEPYNMEGMWAVFMVFGCGMSLACIVFFLETIICKM